MWSQRMLPRLMLLASASPFLSGCADASPACDVPELQLRENTAARDWRDDADRLIAEAPPDSVLHAIVFLSPEAKEAFVAWALSTGGGYGYIITDAPWDSTDVGGTGQRDRGSVPERVPGVMIRYEFSTISAYDVYMPVWALERMKHQVGVAGVELGLAPGHVPLC